MLWSIDATEQTPLHEQIAANVRRAVGEGELTAGERLPTARDLAISLQVNANTVLRAYRTLRDEGVLEFRRGRGVQVRHDAAPGVVVTVAVQQLLQVGRRYGYSPADLARLLLSTKEQP